MGVSVGWLFRRVRICHVNFALRAWWFAEFINTLIWVSRSDEFQLHVDDSLNTHGLVGSQGGYICGVTDQSLLEGKSAP